MAADARPRAVMPLRYVESVDRVRAFYLEQLGFESFMGVVGGDGELDFAIVQRDGAMLMLSRPEAEGVTRGPLSIYVEVADVDAYHAELAARGVVVAKALQTQWWGDRSFAVVDAAGDLLWFWQTVGAISPPPGVKLI
jgi:uncharacterized glyoxalase superfamily protein PhnB